MSEPLDRGLLLSFDGLDSTGKATQTKRLVQTLRDKGQTVFECSTPDYNTPSGQKIKLYFQGKLPGWEDIPWQEKATYFAANRAEHRQEVLDALDEGHIVVYDRYVPSSLAFIAVEALQAHKGSREEVHQFITEEEYTKQAMPHEDASIFLDVDPTLADKLLAGRKHANQDEAEYTDHLHLQQALYHEYDLMCGEQPGRFIRIACMANEQLLPVDEVSELVWQSLLQKFPQLQ